MKINRIPVRINASLPGLSNSYEAWEFKKNSFPYLSGKNKICLASYVVLPKQYKYLCIGYYEDIKVFLDLLKTQGHIVYSSFFISCPDYETSKIIITDITNKIGMEQQ